MELKERYVAAALKHIPDPQKKDVEKEVRKLIDEKMKEKGGYTPEVEEQVLKELGNPRLLAERQLKEPNFLIGPEIFGTYLIILKIVVTVAVAGTLIGNTVDLIVNGGSPLSYFGRSLLIALNAAMGAFGWVTVVFAILERTSKKEILEEIQHDWTLADLPEEEKPQKPFNRIGVIAGIIFTVLVIVLVNQYSHLLGFYYTVDGGGGMQFMPILNAETFSNYLPYINVMLALQLIFTASKLVFTRWTYPVATANLILNALSFALMWFILKDTAILDPKLVANIADVTGEKVAITTVFNTVKGIFLFIFLLDSFEGFHDAYSNSKHSS